MDESGAEIPQSTDQLKRALEDFAASAAGWSA